MEHHSLGEQCEEVFDSVSHLRFWASGVGLFWNNPTGWVYVFRAEVVGFQVQKVMFRVSVSGFQISGSARETFWNIIIRVSAVRWSVFSGLGMSPEP